MTNTATTAPSPINTDDYVAIQRLIHRYADAVVHRNGTQWASCWAEDAEWDLGGGRLVHGKPAITELWYNAMKGFASVVQLVHNGEVFSDPSDPDKATGRWYIDERYRRSDGTTGACCWRTTTTRSLASTVRGCSHDASSRCTTAARWTSPATSTTTARSSSPAAWQQTSRPFAVLANGSRSNPPVN